MECFEANTGNIFLKKIYILSLKIIFCANRKYRLFVKFLLKFLFIFFSAPHVNITFHSVDSRFNPESDLYLESIGILASIPAAWLIATLVVLLIYLCTRCCDTKSTKKRKSRSVGKPEKTPRFILRNTIKNT